MRLTAVLLATAVGACGQIQGTPDANPDVGPPPMLPCLVTSQCITTTPQAAVMIETPVTLDTDSDSRCTVTAQTGGRELCVIHVAGFTLGMGGRLTTTGSRPLVIASTEGILIAGTIDVSSDTGGRTGAGASSGPACTPARAPGISAGGGGGGAGGSFAATGGTGGTGDTDQRTCPTNVTCLGGVAAPAFALSPIHAGCAGQAGGGDGTAAGGPGGASGGALYLVAARTIEITGTIDAGGAGGGTGTSGGAGGTGGGGGGSGGLIVLHSATAVVVATTAIVAANGGGGAEGAVQAAGMLGADGSAGDSRAAGGAGRQPDGGDGGPGGARATATGSPGMEARGGGGGGGGGVGRILVLGPLTYDGVISPPPGISMTMNP